MLWHEWDCQCPDVPHRPWQHHDGYCGLRLAGIPGQQALPQSSTFLFYCSSFKADYCVSSYGISSTVGTVYQKPAPSWTSLSINMFVSLLLATVITPNMFRRILNQGKGLCRLQILNDEWQPSSARDFPWPVLIAVYRRNMVPLSVWRSRCTLW